MANKRPKPEEIVTKLRQRVACWKSELTVCMMSANSLKRTLTTADVDQKATTLDVGVWRE